MTRLRRSSPDRPGITRRRRGRGFSYLGPDGAAVSDGERRRIESLAIPPAWEDVWICPDPLGHLQAVGTDAAGRRQYRYADAWRERNDRVKHERVVQFGSALPAARVQLSAALRATTPGRDRVLAGTVRILDQASLRVGSEQYRVRHATHGLATLRRDHISVVGRRRVSLDFVGKGSQRVLMQLDDPALGRLVGQLLRRRDDDPRLFAWCDGPRQAWHHLVSRDINAYLAELLAGPFTAKDFRTWNATVLMAREIAILVDQSPDDRRTRIVNEGVRRVADHLCNTPAVARRSYIDPRVIDLFHDGVVLPQAVARMPAPVGRLMAPEVEAGVLGMLTEPRRVRRLFREVTRASDPAAAAADLLTPAALSA